MTRLVARIVANALALLATTVVPGISFDRRAGILTLILAGAIFGLFNAVVRPIAIVLSIPALILTLGLFYVVLNGILLWVSSWFIPGYRVEGLLAGILGSVVIAVVNWALGTIFGGERRAEEEA
ncbi:MAG: phage holin family protein [Acidobacteria bacterium]|nr:phage holin family protein [Acidobacteriota bacterium]